MTNSHWITVTDYIRCVLLKPYKLQFIVRCTDSLYQNLVWWCKQSMSYEVVWPLPKHCLTLLDIVSQTIQATVRFRCTRDTTRFTQETSLSIGFEVQNLERRQNSGEQKCVQFWEKNGKVSKLKSANSADCPPGKPSGWANTTTWQTVRMLWNAFTIGEFSIMRHCFSSDALALML